MQTNFTKWLSGGILAGALLMLPACESSQSVGSAGRFNSADTGGVEALTGRVDGGSASFIEADSTPRSTGRTGFAAGANRLRPESRR